jgi:trehalose 6-phosphate phosphatase
MKSILGRDSVGVLSQLGWSRVLLAFDFDGTLAPIVAERGSARMRPRTRSLLRTLCRSYPCAVISGRSHEDVSARLEGAAVKYVVGNHGLEPGAGLAGFEREILRAKSLLSATLADRQGVRHRGQAVLARHSLPEGQAQGPHARGDREGRRGALPAPMRLIPGKLVVNVIPAKAPNKGDALLQLRATEQGRHGVLHRRRRDRRGRLRAGPARTAGDGARRRVPLLRRGLLRAKPSWRSTRCSSSS